MKTLLIGNGARENALSWKLSDSPLISKLFVAPGNAGTSKISENVNLDIMNNEELLNFVNKKNIDLTIVGPEQPLANGVVDYFDKHNKVIFGPNKFCSQLESSKLFARYIMEKNNIPQPAFFECASEEEVLSVSGQLGFPLVMKADGLAAGKGVIICNNSQELNDAIDDMILNKKFGLAASKISVEEFLYGDEVSVFAICDGENYKIINSAQDHKRIFDNDKGPNTGGMGAYSPSPMFTSSLSNKVEEQILKPILNAMKDEGHPYKGFLYLGLMVNDGNPHVIEFNVRLGDPEAQVVLPLYKKSLYDLICSSINGNLDQIDVDEEAQYAVTVVLAAKGYPDKYNKGMQISGLDELDNELIFHAGTKIQDEKFITSGGRVINVVGIDSSLNEAINKAYRVVDSINFKEKYFRTDIGKKAFKYYNNEEQ